MRLKFLTSSLQITDYQAYTYIQLFVFYLCRYKIIVYCGELVKIVVLLIVPIGWQIMVRGARLREARAHKKLAKLLKN